MSIFNKYNLRGYTTVSANSTTNIFDSGVVQDLELAQTALAEHLQKNQARHISAKMKISRQELYPYSAIRVVEVEGTDSVQKTYYIKRLLVQEPRRNRAENQCRKEARLLELLKDRMPSEVVEFVLVIPERLTIVTAACTGVQFSELFRAYFLQQHLAQYKKKMIQISALCGDWLCRFHSSTYDHAEGNANWIKFQCGEADWRADELSIFDPDNKVFYERVARKLEEDFKCLALPPGFSMIHRDFAPHNIFVNPTHIQVLDFTATQQGHGTMDVVNFIANLASHCEHRLVSKKLAHEMCAQFLESYGGLGDKEKMLFQLLIVLQSLKRLLVLYQSKSTGFWSEIAQNGKKWHFAYLKDYIGSAFCSHRMLKSPWQFFDLNDKF